MINFYIVLFKGEDWIKDVFCRHYPMEDEIMKAIEDNDADYAVVEKRYCKLPFA